MAKLPASSVDLTLPKYSNSHSKNSLIGIDSGADRYAYRQGLFVLAQAGEDVVILNDDRYRRPRVKIKTPSVGQRR